MERIKFRFDFDGKEYRFRGYLTAPDAILIKKHTGMTVGQFLTGITTSDPEALVGMVLVAKRQSGELITWDELVEQMVGENDLLALVESVVPIDDEPGPAESSELNGQADVVPVDLEKVTAPA